MITYRFFSPLESGKEQFRYPLGLNCTCDNILIVDDSQFNIEAFKI